MKKFQFVLLTGLVTPLTVYYFYLTNLPKYSRSNIYQEDSRSNIYSSEKNSLNRIHFADINEKYCNVEDLKLDQHNCLNHLKNFDDKIKNDNLKERNYDKCSECFEDNGNKKKTIYHHTFWQINSNDSKFSNFHFRVLKLNIKSFLATQNLCCTKLILWKLKEFPSTIEIMIRKIFSHYISKGKIEIKLFDLLTLCSLSRTISTSVFHKYEICKSNETSSSHRLVALSDFIRFVVLDLYPGIYTDGDVVYLKDMKLLWNSNFAYRWSFTTNYNTAVLGIDKTTSSDINQIYDLAFINKNTVGSLTYILHPILLTNLIISNYKCSIFNFGILKAYHSFMFDPAWLCFDGVVKKMDQNSVCSFKEFNSKNLIKEDLFHPEKFFPGAFTYHLHLANCGSEIRNDSYFRYFEKYYKKILNLYE